MRHLQRLPLRLGVCSKVLVIEDPGEVGARGA